MIAVTRAQWEHHTLASSFACAHAGILCQRAAAAGVYVLLWIDSGMAFRFDLGLTGRKQRFGAALGGVCARGFGRDDGHIQAGA